jgi:hypothetical protein
MSDVASTPYISIAWAACPRWAVRESADLIDVIEQPAGQTCAVLIDVQGTGALPRRLGSSLMLEARSLLSGGVGADLAAHTLSQLLYSRREGQVGATILVASISASRCRAEIAGYGDATIALRTASGWTCGEIRRVLAGHDPGAGPDGRVFGLENDAVLVISSDGLARTCDAMIGLAAAMDASLQPDELVDGLISAAIERDNGRPSGDMAALAVQIASVESNYAIERGQLVRPGRRPARA